MLVTISHRQINLWATYVLLGINIGAYIAGVLATGRLVDLSATKYLTVFAYFKFATFYYGLYWQFFTNIFIHVNILHISLNMFFLYILGIQLERIVGGTKLIKIYLLSGFGGNILSTIFFPLGGGAGASGAIFGIFGYLTMYHGVLGGRTKTMILYALMIFIVNSFIPNVDLFAHLGGLIVGLIWGYLDGKRFIRKIRFIRYL